MCYLILHWSPKLVHDALYFFLKYVFVQNKYVKILKFWLYSVWLVLSSALFLESQGTFKTGSTTRLDKIASWLLPC